MSRYLPQKEEGRRTSTEYRAPYSVPAPYLLRPSSAFNLAATPHPYQPPDKEAWIRDEHPRV